MRMSMLALGAVVVAAVAVPAVPAMASGSYKVTVTCSVPKSQPERQLAPNSCLNYIPDGTQTFTAHVRNSSGKAVSGVTVKWTDSDTKDAQFRSKQNPCTTGSNGTCSAELADSHPKSGEKIKVTATAGGSSAVGYVSFK